EAEAVAPEVSLPVGCVRDLKPEKAEHRRVILLDGTSTPWAIKTEIVHPPQDDPGGKFDEIDFLPSENTDSNDKTTIQRADGSGVPFEDYVLNDGSIDWEGKNINHVCIRLDHVGSHDQLWVLWNTTGSLHNFHIHQMKFRLARRTELEARHINPPKD